MKQPIIDAFKKSDGYLPEIHKAAIEVAFKFNNKHRNFKRLKIGLFKLQKLVIYNGLHHQKRWIAIYLASNLQENKGPERLLRDMGHHPYRAKQPNGWSDHSEDWMSPELLIRRLVFAQRSFAFTRLENNNQEFYEKVITKNFDNPNKILNYTMKQDSKMRRKYEMNILLFNHPEFLKA